ncbi:MAG: extensin family protein [Shimia sp.]
MGASAVPASPPDSSLRPVLRPQTYPVALPSLAPERSLRPVMRPVQTSAAVDRAATVTAVPAVAAAPQLEATQAGLFKSKKKERRKAGIGKVCRDRKLIGQEIDPVPGKLPGCGISKGAIRLYEVEGVKLSTPSVMNCDTAKALQTWVDKGMNKAVRSYGGGAREIKVAAHYACRTRNHKKGAKISEHGKGNAIDISAVTLKNGDTISVLKDWNNGKKGRILKKMHKSACGPFGTVLGPNADRYHKDHFHFDVARHRSGSYCR